MIFIKKIILPSVILLFLLTSCLNAQNKKAIYNTSNSSNNSSIMEYDIPASLKSGQEFAITISMVNTGSNTWKSSGGYWLSVYSVADNNFQTDIWDTKTVALPYDVLPQQKVSFLFNIRAPYTPGSYNCNWAMTKDNEYFGEYNMSVVNVGGGNIPVSGSITENNSEYLNQNIPSTMTAGQNYKIMISMKNNGKTTWLPASRGEYKLSLINNPSDKNFNSSWNTSPVYLSQSVEPGQTSNIEFNVTAPSVSGVYNLQWMMQQGNSFFGEGTPSVSVNVVNGSSSSVDHTLSYNSSFMEQTVPDQMTLKKEQNITLVMSNTGTKTWIMGSEKLVLIDGKMSPQSLNSWNVGYVQLPFDVEPGKLVTFNFNVKPDETGWQHFQWIMMNGNGETFGATSKPIEVIVSK